MLQSSDGDSSSASDLSEDDREGRRSSCPIPVPIRRASVRRLPSVVLDRDPHIRRHSPCTFSVDDIDDENNDTVTFPRVTSPVSQWSPDTEEFDTREIPSAPMNTSQSTSSSRGIYGRFIQATPGVDRSHSPFVVSNDALSAIVHNGDDKQASSRPVSPNGPHIVSRPKTPFAMLRSLSRAPRHYRTASAAVPKPEQTAKRPTHHRYATGDWNMRELERLHLGPSDDDDEEMVDIEDDPPRDVRAQSRASQRSISSRVFKFFKGSEGESHNATILEPPKNKKSFKSLKRMVSKIVK
ncbi:hypothetical protein BT69DRAFT_1279370 [Atractiella rhizophila]|nr:hypothetical protein BT69DRAFT_1279370 [Atractiella rhizophila]